MPLQINLRHLEAHDIELEGDLAVEQLELDLRDDLTRAEKPLHYDLFVQKLDNGLLLQGSLCLPLQCQCVRCLKPFEKRLELGDWTRHLPLDGEDKAVVENDCVDLTPYIREDILLELPQHPLCKTDCSGLPETNLGKSSKPNGTGEKDEKSSAWAELDKLKL